MPDFMPNRDFKMWTDTPIAERGPPPYSPPANRIYNTSGGPVDGKINVHLVSHTHDDTGWLYTVDQYFYKEVYYIIDTVVMRLLEDSNRRFIYVEVGFFARWWDEQPDSKRDQVRSLVSSGQLEFVNGGWCMHDEASPYYVEMIDQTTRGHQFLKKEFGITAKPKGTWQIDPFGHSNTNAWLIAANSEMEYEFWGRMDRPDFEMRALEKRLEWIWQGSQSLGDSAQIFAGQIFDKAGMGYGGWLMFDSNKNLQVQDDPTRHDYNVDYWVDTVVAEALLQSQSFKTDHQMWACGEDFNYQNAIHWYHNLDKLIHYVNQNTSINIFYSTPSVYVEQKKKANITWEVRKDDIFPLMEGDGHAFWSGYFTSRPSLKRQVRVASNFLNAARQLEVLSKVPVSKISQLTTRPSPRVGSSWTDSLEGTVGLATHHDGMSGTERQNVANDYAQRISESQHEVEQGVGLSFNVLLGNASYTFEHCNCNKANGADCLNITMCPITTNSPAFTVVAWNPTAQPATHFIHLPVKNPTWQVTTGSQGPVPSQVVEIDERTLELPLYYLNRFLMTKGEVERHRERMRNNATHVLSFEMVIPPLGYATYTATSEGVKAAAAVLQRRKATENFSISNELYRVDFDAANGVTSKITNLKSGASTDLSIKVAWYNSSVGGCTKSDEVQWELRCALQASGAYMFRPNSSELFYPGPAATPTLNLVEGSEMTEVYQVFSDWATVVYRLYKNESFLEVEWTVGPIPEETPWFPQANPKHPNYWGKEVVVQYQTSLQTDKTFYTDANGKEMVKRVRNARGPSYPPFVVTEPVAGNYYPVNSMVAVDDGEVEFAVVTDVSQGGGSIYDGEIELMVHRRLQHDDSRGVQEPLNETMCGCNDIRAVPDHTGADGHEGDGGCWCDGLVVRGKHFVLFGGMDAVNTDRRKVAEKANFPPTLAFSQSVFSTPASAAFMAPLPPQLKLLTLTSNYAEISSNQLLLRITHLYATGESSTLSVPVTVNLASIFSKPLLKLATIQETQLTAYTALSQQTKWATYDPVGAEPEYEIFNQPHRLNVTDMTVTIRPAEVKTFLVTFE
eukprot:TRINITY_DN18114_c0_g1_i1.p1 TRINITY_DN18114_c0_g1~~TRINITY_DN18114_c0_g1_i1.p1  ORF type:complete len:1107 (+),score=202.08 TRINITY_DN18114_c0_g1_i1:107-3322(+)